MIDNGATVQPASSAQGRQAVSSFQVDPKALETASAAFAAQVGPITREGANVGEPHGNPGNTGSTVAYVDAGISYNDDLTKLLATFFTSMAAKTHWVADTLTATAKGYQHSDSVGAAGLRAAGKGA